MTKASYPVINLTTSDIFGALRNYWHRMPQTGVEYFTTIAFLPILDADGAVRAEVRPWHAASDEDEKYMIFVNSTSKELWDLASQIEDDFLGKLGKAILAI